MRQIRTFHAQQQTFFTTPLDNNLGSVNELHTETKNMIHKKTWSRNQTPARISILDLIQKTDEIKDMKQIFGLIKLMNRQAENWYLLHAMRQR